MIHVTQLNKKNARYQSDGGIGFSADLPGAPPPGIDSTVGSGLGAMCDGFIESYEGGDALSDGGKVALKGANAGLGVASSLKSDLDDKYISGQ